MGMACVSGPIGTEAAAHTAAAGSRMEFHNFTAGFSQRAPSQRRDARDDGLRRLDVQVQHHLLEPILQTPLFERELPAMRHTPVYHLG